MSLFRRIWYWLQKFQREHPEPFLISFQFYILSLLWFNSLFLLADSSVHIDSYELCLLGKGNQAFGDKRFYLDRSGIDCKMFQRGHPKPILTIFRFFYKVYYWPNFNFYWTILPSESIHMNRDSSEKLTQSLEIRVFICNDLLLAEKRFQKVSPEQFWTRFQFFFY